MDTQVLKLMNGEGFDAQGKPVAPPVPVATAPQPTTTQPTANPRIDELTKLLFTPASSTQQLYQTAYDSAGLKEIKTRLADLDKRIAQRRSGFTNAQGTIDENPWLSEASRVGRQGRLKNMAEAEISNLLDEYDQYAKLYGQGLDEINGRLSRETADASNTRSTYQDELNYLLNERDKVENRAYDFTSANNILYPFFKQPGSNQVFDSRTLESLSFEEYKKRGGVGVAGMDKFPDVQEITHQEKPVEISPGNSLVDPTTGEVIYQAPYKPTTPRSPGGEKKITLTTAKKYGLDPSIPSSTYSDVIAGINQAKQEMNGQPYYEVWGKVAEWLQANGEDPDQWDLVLWDMLHPEGLAGYKKYKNPKEDSSISNPFG